MSQLKAMLKTLKLLILLFIATLSCSVGCEVNVTSVERSTSRADAFKAPPEEMDRHDMGCFPQDELCNEADDDCDGNIDEGFGLGDQCDLGQGICLQQGVIACIDSVDVTAQSSEVEGAYCQAIQSEMVMPEEGERGGECDGLDNDCDGFVDEHYINTLQDCGEGACAERARLVCAQGELVSLCREGEPLESDHSCDGVDNDCDGRGDEGFIPAEVRCGIGQCVNTGSEICTPEGPITICSPLESQNLDDDCDGLDDDCDGNIDEGFVEETVECGIGACRVIGYRQCVNGTTTTVCVPRDATSDDNCDGIDNDCDTRLDEGYLSQPSTCGLGICARQGQTLCVSGVETDTCQEGQPSLRDTTCDQRDDDCDGEIDEDFAPMQTSCGYGDCFELGLRLCVEGMTIDTCVPGVRTSSRDNTCDGRDNDCDARIDEDFVGAEVDCGEGSCAAEGRTLCSQGIESGNTCVSGEPAENDATCDGVDDDCDGETDEDAPSQEISCGQGLCVQQGLRRCDGGQIIDDCTPLEPNTTDTSCDQRDNDCDGLIDEAYQVSPTVCGLGDCQNIGTMTCVNGEEVDSCSPLDMITRDHQCDQRDNDCDGTSDEDYVIVQTTCGLGACARQGLLLCTAQGTVDTCTPDEAPMGESDHSCDDIDQDCDGILDEGFESSQTTCGDGVCLRNGQTVCQNGSITDNCTSGAPLSQTDELCDLVDEDCDGTVDEGYIPIDVSCSMGGCSSTGQVICTTNGLVNTCIIEPLDTDSSCDGADDDCDGVIDEDYLPPEVSTQCGDGVCATTGSFACVNGSVIDTCQPLDLATEDINCDAIDNDCDGSVDEGFEGSSQCGIGACERSGALICIEGDVISSCVPGVPRRHDLCGNNTDDNCDGRIQRYPIGEICTSGVGDCFFQGTYRCNRNLDGVVCYGFQQTRSEVCDGADNDCDEVIDENVCF